MPSTFLGLSIASSGMAAYSAHFNTTAHNISNARTEGYTRQWVEQTTKSPISTSTSFGMIGTGSQAVAIYNSRDEYYDYKFRKTNATYGYYSTGEYYMKSLEDYLYSTDSESAGISNSMNSFFNRLTDLITSSGDTTKRTEAMGYADTLATYVNETIRSFEQMQDELNMQINTAVNQINAYGEQIASLNKQIATLEVFGNQANDLRDQRAKLIDELSSYADIDVLEKPPADGNGLSQYIVYFGGGILVDTNNYNTLELIPSETRTNQNDVEGLYDLVWSNGIDFDIRNGNLGGQLQALFDIRDGNNGENFQANFQNFDEDNNTFTVVANPSNSDTASNIAKLNIPASDGVIKINHLDFKYDSFSVKVAADGTYTYTFNLSNELSEREKAYLTSSLPTDERTVAATIGDSVNYRGIPYYMAQLNEFVRTFSASFNQQQNRGYDMYGNKGVDLFVAKDATSSQQLDMTEFLKSSKDGYYYLNGNKVFTGDDYNSYFESDYGTDGYTLSEVTDDDAEAVIIGGIEYTHYQITDNNNDGKVVEEIYVSQDDNNIFSFNSLVSADEKASYYNMTADNFSASKDMVRDGKLLAASARDPLGDTTGSVDQSGQEEAENLLILASIQSDKTMFKQGNPIEFIQSITTTVGVDSQKMIKSTKNAQNINDAVDTRRLSTAGVDEDEEGQMLIEVRNLLNIQYRVVSVMNEVLNKLINEMGL